MFTINEKKTTSVLFVDDEIHILNSLRRGLLGENYKCVFVDSGEKALKVMSEEIFSVIVTDMRMPNMNGLKLLKEVKSKYPDTIRIVLSGYTQFSQLMSTINQAEIFKFIAKPWNLENEFKPIINQAIEYNAFKVKSRKSQKILQQKNMTYKGILKNSDLILKCYKTDVETTKKIFSSILNYKNNYIELYNSLDDKKQISLVLSNIHWSDDIFNNYLLQLPSKEMKFSIENLVSDLNKLFVFSGREDINTLLNNNDTLTYEGNYSKTFFIIKTFLVYLFSIDKNSVKEIYIDNSESDKFHVLIKFFPIDLTSNSIKLKFKLITEVIQHLNATLSLSIKNEIYNLTIYIN